MRRCLMAAFDLPEAAFEIVVIKVTGDQIQDKALKRDRRQGPVHPRDRRGAAGRRHRHRGPFDEGHADAAARGAGAGLLSAARGRAGCVRLARLSARWPSCRRGRWSGRRRLRRRAQLALAAAGPAAGGVPGQRADADAQAGRRAWPMATFLAMAGLNAAGDGACGAVGHRAGRDAAGGGAGGDRGGAAGRRMRGWQGCWPRSMTGETGLRLAAERAFLARLDGSCETPIAGLAVLEGDQLWLRGEILRPDGSASVAGERRGPVGRGGRRWAGAGGRAAGSGRSGVLRLRG